MDKVPKGPARRRLAAAAAAFALLAAGAGLYGYGRVRGNGQGGCAPAAETLARLRPLARGEVAAFDVGESAVRAPAFDVAGPDGERRTLGSFSGRTILLNLWATWCEPCKREMPALDRLQAELGGDRFEVVAVNIDTRNLDRPRAWLAEAGVRRLAYYADPEARIFQAFRRAGDAEGMPTTLLIDGRGCRLGRLSGPAEWAGSEGSALVRAALAP